MWANALHAVRLNELPSLSSRLRLGDSVVGLLSTLAPLALAGAVHLYILIARHAPAVRTSDGMRSADGDLCGSASCGSADPCGSGDSASARAAELDGLSPDHGSVITLDDAAVQSWYASSAGASPSSPSGPEHARAEDAVAADFAVHKPDGYSAGLRVRVTKPAGRPPGASLDELVEIGRAAWRASGRLSRTVVDDAVRARGTTLASKRLTKVMDILRAEEEDAAEQLTLG